MKDGYKDSSLGMIPKNWDVGKLYDVMTIRHGKDQKKITTENGKYPILGTSGEIGRTDSFLYDKPSVLIGRKGTIDRPQYMETPFWTIDTLFYSEVTTGVLAKWLYFYFQTINWKLYNEASGVPSLSSKTISNIPIIIPPLPEQQKIADILTTVDDKLENIESQIAEYISLKTGLMQQLLTKGIGHEKFVDSEFGNMPVDWKVIKLGDLLSRKPEYGASAASIKYSFDCLRYIRITDIDENGNLIDANIAGVDKTDGKGYLLNHNDILIARTGNTVGKSYIHKQKNGESAYAGYLIRFVTNPDKLLPSYLFQFIHSPYYWKWVKSTLRTGAQPNINSNEYQNLPIPLPPIKEQQTIVDILLSVDDKLESLQQKKEECSKLKRGLMEQLLTGRIRVKV